MTTNYLFISKIKYDTDWDISLLKENGLCKHHDEPDGTYYLAVPFNKPMPMGREHRKKTKEMVEIGKEKVINFLIKVVNDPR